MKTRTLFFALLLGAGCARPTVPAPTGEEAPPAGAGAGAGAEARPRGPVPIERLLPEDTFLFLSIDDVSRSGEDLRKTALHAIWAEEEVQMFLEKPLRKLRELAAEMERRYGFSLDDVRKAFRGQVAVAMCGLEPRGEGEPQGMGAVLARVTDRAAAGRLFDAALSRIRSDPPEGHELLELDRKGWLGMIVLERKEENPDRFILALSDELAVAAICDVGYGGIDALLAARPPPPKSLGLSEEFKRVMGRLGEKGLCSLYVSGGRIREMAVELAREEGLEDAEVAERIIEKLGLAGIRGMGVSFSVDAPGIVQRGYIHAPAPRKGALALVREEPVRAETLRLAPAGASGFFAVRFELSGLMPVIRHAAAAAGEDAAAGLEEALERLGEMTGVDLERDVLRNVGDEFALVVLPAPAAANLFMAGMGGLSAIVRLRDASAFERALDKLAAVADASLRAGGRGSVQELTYRGHRLRYARLAAGLFAPTVAVVGDRLVASANVGETKRLIRALEGKAEPLVETDEFRAALRRIGGKLGSSVSYGGPRQSLLAQIPTFATMAGTILPTMARVREQARRAQCRSNLKQLGLGCHMYAQDHGEEFPPNLEALQDRYVPDPELFSCPSRPGKMSYVYVSGLKSTDPADSILAYDLPRNHSGGGVNVLHIDGHVRWVADGASIEAQARRQVEALKARGRKAKLVRPPEKARPAELFRVGDPSEWIELALVPPPESYLQHLFPRIGTMTVDGEGITLVGYGPMGNLGGSDMTSVGTVGILSGLLLPSLGRAREQARRAQCLSNLKQLGLGCHMYSQDHREEFSPNLEALHDRYAADRLLFSCPSAPAEMSYVYVSGLKSTDRASWVVAYDLAKNHKGDGVNVLYLDAHVKWVADAASVEAQAKKQVEELRARGRAAKIVSPAAGE